MIFEHLSASSPTEAPELRRRIREAYRADEDEIISQLLDQVTLPRATQERIATRAYRLATRMRKEIRSAGGVDALLAEYDLSTQEGIALMCLAEAMLRVPDPHTAYKLIQDKVSTSDWERHLGTSDSIFVQASTWGLILAGQVVRPVPRDSHEIRAILHRLVARSGAPIVHTAIRQAMALVGSEFVLGQTIEEALNRAHSQEKRGFRYSYDMLGEAARTQDDAWGYYNAYYSAIEVVGRSTNSSSLLEQPGISVKLSALHPRYEFAQYDRIMNELLPRLRGLALAARDRNLPLTIDAEEADRLDLSLDVIEALSKDPELTEWDGLGVAVQAYQKRAFYLLDWLIDLAQRHNRRLMVRLVKGAYWDTEIKRSQEKGLVDYPVFTRKAATDVSFLACARKLLAAEENVYPQFATHNAHTVAAILEMAEPSQGFEFQRLHGMGKALYDQIVNGSEITQGRALPCRIYAPVGSHRELLAYLVRRLLENGANSSFLNQLHHDDLSVEEIIADPAERLRSYRSLRNPWIPLPAKIYGPERRNSKGLDLTDLHTLAPLAREMREAAAQPHQAVPIVGGVPGQGEREPVYDPANHHYLGEAIEATSTHIDRALEKARRAQPDWDQTPVEERAACLDRLADLYEAHMPELMALCVREAGKSLPDAVAEVREAVDFCRYYAMRARADFGEPIRLPGPTGEYNHLTLHGRGVFVCISPWNFPLAIFTGQVTAALASGNTVIAKPAEQTPMIATAAVRLMHQAEIPAEVVHLLPGEGSRIGGQLLSDPRIAGIAFTGSVETARTINQTLAQRSTGPILPLIAETGGQNTMIVDSTALPEQVVADVISSAFLSAGQRCSALRVLFLQEDVAEHIIEMLVGAMHELVVGDPAWLKTDVGPVIDNEAKAGLEEHLQRMYREGHLLAQTPLPPETQAGTFVPPTAFEIDRLDRLHREVFGPILHVIRYPAERLDEVLETINATGYGLTLGIQSRINTTADYIHRHLRVGNTYVNRNMVGSVVGAQPFGGEGLSGTGPKAGGPHYLHRFATERTLTIDTTAVGGNASLFALEEGERAVGPAPKATSELRKTEDL